VSSILPDPTEEPTVSIERAARILGIGRSKAYELARLYEKSDGADGIPCVRVGRAQRVSSSALLAMVRLEAS
jgi:hypothetical protein